MTDTTKTIKFNWPKDKPWPFLGAAAIFPALVDWFPPLTVDQHTANAVALVNGEPQPYTDPNLIHVEFRP
jgi:hypothetical protein